MRLAKKVAAGAQFVQTQIVYNVSRFREFMAGVCDLGLHERVHVLAGVAPIRSAGVHVMAIQWPEAVPEVVKRSGLWPRPETPVSRYRPS